MRIVSTIFFVLIIALTSPAQSNPIAGQKSSAKVGQPKSDAQDKISSCWPDLVVLPMSASLQNGSYVENLTHKELRVFENDVNQEIVFFSSEAMPSHIVLIFDTNAGSAEKLQQMKNAAVSFVERLSPTDHIKIIAFDDSVRELCDFTNDHARLRDAISSIKLGQGNKLYDAIHEAITAVKESKGSERAIVVLKSGAAKETSSYSDDYTLYELTQSCSLFYSICYGIEDKNLEPHAERSGGKTYLASSPTLLAEAFAKITRDLSAVCWLGYYSTNIKRDGIYRKIEVQSTRKNVMIRAPSGYFAPDDKKPD
jgi:Ca-activated chloride channel family protein